MRLLEQLKSMVTARPGDPPRRLGATCGDGLPSGARGRGACSWHGGVSRWRLAPPFDLVWSPIFPVWILRESQSRKKRKESDERRERVPQRPESRPD
jgi:hypothetical protein